jgi:hypothetical protein
MPLLFICTFFLLHHLKLSYNWKSLKLLPIQFMGYKFWSVICTTFLHIVPTLRMGGALPPFITGVFKALSLDTVKPFYRFSNIRKYMIYESHEHVIK